MSFPFALDALRIVRVELLPLELAVAPSVTASIRMMPGDSSTDRALG
jgi:hypothetical protein